MATLLINQEQLAQESVLNENVDFKLLRQLIVDTQDIHIQQLLGSRLYNKLITEVTNATITGVYATLLNTYVRPCMIAYIVSESPDYLNVKYMNKAIVLKSSDNSKPMDDAQIIRLMEAWRNKAQFRAERVTKYLMENRTSFPEFDVPATGEDAILPNKQNYNTGMYLDDDDFPTFGFERFRDKDHY